MIRVNIDNRWWVVLLAMLAMTACDKVQLTAPTESTITLFTNATVVPVGGTVEITASVIEQAGTAVQNGTVVNFTTTVGALDPREARTQNGKATVRLVAGGTSGTARVRAFSGSAQSEPLEISVGGAAVASLLLRVSPGTIPPTGTPVEVVATAVDASGNRLPGVPVTFSASAGQLSPGSTVTDANGEARATLVTSTQTTVTAVAGAQTATQTVSISQLPSIAITVSPTPTVGEAVTFTLTLTAGGSPVQRVVVDFGDGSSETLATSGTTSVAHVYRSTGLYTVKATVTDAAGQSAAATAIINVQPRAPFSVVLAASPAAPAPLTPVTFTATVAGGGTTSTAQPVSYFWDFGDGTSRTTSGNATTHVYDRVGQRTVTVTVTTTDGRTATAVTEIIVQ